MVFPDKLKISAISLVVFPSFTRLATRISEGVRPKYLEDNFWENGETISLRLDSRMSTQDICPVPNEVFLNLSR